MEKNKSKKLGPQEIRKSIASILFNKFLDYFSCVEKNTIQQSFRINNLIGKAKRENQIQTKNKHALFTSIINRPETEKMVYLKIINSKKNTKDKEKAS